MTRLRQDDLLEYVYLNILGGSDFRNKRDFGNFILEIAVTGNIRTKRNFKERVIIKRKLQI